MKIDLEMENESLIVLGVLNNLQRTVSEIYNVVADFYVESVEFKRNLKRVPANFVRQRRV